MGFSRLLGLLSFYSKEGLRTCTEISDVDEAYLFVWAADDALVEGKSNKSWK
jgi:hypothetical protein